MKGRHPIIYKTTNLINGKIYVGSDISNIPSYLGSGKILKCAIKKYGKDNFQKEILDICSFSMKEDLSNLHEIINWLDEKERFWIKKINSQDKNIGYNIADGGHRWSMNDHIRKQISDALKNRTVTWQEKMRENRKKNCVKVIATNLSTGEKKQFEKIIDASITLQIPYHKLIDNHDENFLFTFLREEKIKKKRFRSNSKIYHFFREDELISSIEGKINAIEFAKHNHIPINAVIYKKFRTSFKDWKIIAENKFIQKTSRSL